MRFKSKDLSVRVVGQDRKLRMVLLVEGCNDELTLTGCDTNCTATQGCGDCTCETQCQHTTENITGTGAAAPECYTRCEAITEIMGFHLKLLGELIGITDETVLTKVDEETQLAELEAIIEGLRSQQRQLKPPDESSE
jgi:hypothetical protein